MQLCFVSMCMCVEGLVSNTFRSFGSTMELFSSFDITEFVRSEMFHEKCVCVIFNVHLMYTVYFHV